MSAQAGGQKRESGGTRILPLVISLLTLVPNGFVASAAAQTFNAARGITPAVAAGAAGAAAASVSVVPAALSPLHLGSGPQTLSAPPSALAGPAVAATPSPWDYTKHADLRAAVLAGARSTLPASAIPASAPSAENRYAAARQTAGETASIPDGASSARSPEADRYAASKTFDAAAKKAASPEDAAVAPSRTEAPDPFGRIIGWNDMKPEPADAPSSLAQVSLDVPAGARYEPSPADWRDETFYALIIDRFNRSAPFTTWGDPADGRMRHGGNIRGLIDKLDYIQGLGATTILVSPIVMNPPLASHQYWAVHFMAVDPQLGTMADFKRLVAEAHKRGMHVVLDMVFNHTGPVIQYKDGFHFGSPKEIERWNYPVKPVELARPEHFNRRGDINDWNNPEQKQFGDLPGGINSMATSNPATQDILLKIAKWWVKETDVDGFRLDVYKHVHPTFWTRFFKEIREYAGSLGKKNFLLVGELYDGDPNNLVPEVRGDRLDSAYNYPAFYRDFAALHGEVPTRMLEESFNSLRATLGGALGRLVHFLDNHDRYRFLRGRDESVELWNDSDQPKSAQFWVDASITPPGTELVDLNDANYKVTTYAENGGSKVSVDMPPRGRRVLVRRWISELHHLSPSHKFGTKWVRAADPNGVNAVSSIRKADSAEILRFALAFVMLSVGIPYIFYGNEQAFRHMPEREWLDLETSRDDMFSDGKFKNAANQDTEAFNPGSPTYKMIAALAAARKAHPALRRGDQYVRWSDPSGPGLFAFSRIHDGQEVLVVMNNADEPRSAEMNVDARLTPAGTTLVDEMDAGYSAATRAQEGGASKVSVEVPAHGVRVLVRSR